MNIKIIFIDFYRAPEVFIFPYLLACQARTHSGQEHARMDRWSVAENQGPERGTFALCAPDTAHFKASAGQRKESQKDQ